MRSDAPDKTEGTTMRVTFLAALLIAAFAFRADAGPVSATAEGTATVVKGAAQGTATVARGTARGTAAAGRGVARGTVAAGRATGRGVKCVATLFRRCY
jgi:hypothetical protein